jgi:Flp pilus assembly protein TadG
MARRILRPPFVRRFADARRGAVAVEFAFVAFPFILLLFGILELALVFIVTTTLESATESAARKVRTGEFQTGAAHAKKDFRDSVCARMSWLSTPCQSNLYVDVRTFAANDFAGMSSSGGYNAATFNANQTCWANSEPSDIVLVRTFYQWNLFTPLLNGALQNMGAGTSKRMITSAVAFRNEPYNNNSPIGAQCILGGQNG